MARIKWRPISTIPADMAAFLGYVPRDPSGGGGGVFVCIRHPDGEFSVPVPRDISTDLSFYPCVPTYWRSLPQVPRLATDLFSVEGPARKAQSKQSKWIVSRPIAGGPDLFFLMADTSAEAEDFCKANNENFIPNAESI